MLRAVGDVVEVPEVHMDAITAVSGSGPAYYALLAEAMIDAGLLLGLSREISTRLVVQTMLGTARLLRERHGYKGEIRAIGTVIKDLLLGMHRCGFDTFLLREDQDPADALRAFAADLGEETFVVEGRLTDEYTSYGKGVWFRMPCGVPHAPFTGGERCKMLIREGDLVW